MITLSEQTVHAYDRRMERHGVPARERTAYLRWVRFYLDFCQKYGHPPRDESSLPHFLEKLESKKQPAAATPQASRAIHLLLRREPRSTGNRDGKIEESPISSEPDDPERSSVRETSDRP